MKFAGYDVYDLRSNELFAFLASTRLGTPILEFADRHPVFIRNILFLHPRRYAKAMALFIEIYLWIYQKTQEKSCLENVAKCETWFMENIVEMNGVWGWGLPLEWKSGSTIYPKNRVPFLIDTAYAVISLLKILRDGYSSNKAATQKALEKVYEGLLKKSSSMTISSGESFFRFSPIDEKPIHNSNLYTAYALLSLNKYLNQKGPEPDRIRQSIFFTLKRQKADGRWTYGDPDSDAGFDYTDNFHSVYILRALKCIHQYYNEKEIENAIKKGVQFYCREMVDPFYGPKFRPDRIFPIEIHSCAAQLLVYAEFHTLIENAAAKINERLEWLKKNMWDRTGYFYYRLKKDGTLVKVPFIKWGQAWMARALMEVLKTGIM